jgi:hypothetical protein
MLTERRRGSKIDFALVLFLVIQVMGLGYLGLTPFSFSPRNRVEPLTNPPGIQFNALGIATSRESVRSEEQFPDDSLSIHLMIEPDDEPRGGLGTILSIEDERRGAQLIVAQWKSWLVVRVNDPTSANLGYWEIDAADFQVGDTHLVSITSGPTSGTTIYVDGVASGDTRRRTIIRSDERFDGRLLLGCLGNGSAGWRGKLFGLAITNSVLNSDEIAAQYEEVRDASFKSLHRGQDRDFVAFYDFVNTDFVNTDFANTDFANNQPQLDGLLHTVPNRVAGSRFGDIEIPETFAPLRPSVFNVPRLRDMKADWFLRDLIRNITGFFPFGFTAAVILIRRSKVQGYATVFQVAILGGLLSLVIETVQIALPMRNSSLSDLSLNIIGAAIGAVIAFGFWPSSSENETT